MRVLTNAGVPFSIEYLSYNSTKRVSEGFKKETNVQLRQGYRDDQSDKASVLIGYTNNNDGKRWFYLPLLIKFNGYKVIP